MMDKPLDTSIVRADHVQKNRAMWEAQSDSYEARHSAVLAGEKAMTWGLWRIPETELNVLGNVLGKDILEYGCGAARWSIALTQVGARPVGLDITARQLYHAQREMAAANVNFPLVQANAETVPLADNSFDIAFCDWGAMTFCDPYKTVPEVARVLRPGGLFAFACGTAFNYVCFNQVADTFETGLLNDYFGMRKLEWEDSVDFFLTYGDWVRLFRHNNFIIEDLIENRPAEGVSSTYRSESENNWARHWPMENIWKVRKQ